MSADLGHERSLLGAILLAPSRAIPGAMAGLCITDFVHPAHAAIFAAIRSLDAQHQPVDAVTVWECLGALGLADRLTSEGGRGYLGTLLSEAGTVDNVAWYARAIRRRAERRHWQQVLIGLVADSKSNSTDEEFFNHAETTLMSLTNWTRRDIDHTPQEIRQILHCVLADIDIRKESCGVLGGVPTGFAHFDALTQGLQPDSLVVVAARPGMGKTALAMNMAVSAASAGHPVLIFTLEMSAKSLVERMLSGEGNVDATNIRTGSLSTKDWVALSKGATRLATAPIWVEDLPAMTIADIRSRARRWRMQLTTAKAPLVVVDYLQLASGTDRSQRDNREREIAEISRGLKQLAKEISGPVMALSQLNRAVETRTEKRPTLSDLRESGAIEQDADLIAFIYRACVYEAKADKHEAELIIAKHRSGPTGVVKMHWTPETTKFRDQ